MKHLSLIPCLALTCLAACATTEATKPTMQSVSDWGDHPMEDPEYMAAVTRYMAPSEAHEEIAKRAGTWNIRTKMLMEAGGEPIDMDATAESKMILGGRFLLEEFHGSMMGSPFEGMLILGFNNLTEEYFSIWMDTWGTGVSSANGPADAKGSIQMTGSMADVLTPKGRPYRHVTRAKGSGFVSELYDTLPDGTEWMVMEMTYTRRPTE